MVHVLNVQTGEDLNPPIKFLACRRESRSAPCRQARCSTRRPRTTAAARRTVCTRSISSSEQVRHDRGTQKARRSPAPWRRRSAPTAPSTSRRAAASADNANAVVALDSTALTSKDWFSAGSPFVSAPIVFQCQGKDMVAAASRDGRIYLLDGASLGGADHKTAAREVGAVRREHRRLHARCARDLAGCRRHALDCRPVERLPQSRREVRDDQRRRHDRCDRRRSRSPERRRRLWSLAGCRGT